MADFGQGARGVAKWIVGPLQKGLFGIARTVGRARLDVYALRCPNCSHLELFAR